MYFYLIIYSFKFFNRLWMVRLSLDLLFIKRNNVYTLIHDSYCSNLFGWSGRDNASGARRLRRRGEQSGPVAKLRGRGAACQNPGGRMPGLFYYYPEPFASR